MCMHNIQDLRINGAVYDLVGYAWVSGRGWTELRVVKLLANLFREHAFSIMFRLDLAVHVLQ